MNRATPAEVAAMLGGIRAAQPRIGASSVEALLHIATGADSSTALQQRMGLDRSSVSRIVSQLTGRGTVGRTAVHSNLRLVQRRVHPHKRGTQLSLTPEGRELLELTFTHLDDAPNAPRFNRAAHPGQMA